METLLEGCQNAFQKSETSVHVAASPQTVADVKKEVHKKANISDFFDKLSAANKKVPPPPKEGEEDTRDPGSVAFPFLRDEIPEKAKALRGHKVESELEEKKSHDCIKSARDQLIEEFGVAEADLDAMAEEIEAEAQDAYKFAEESPIPDPSKLYDYTYAE